MCELCGCQEYIKQGKEEVLRRITEVVEELALTPENVADYEDTEIISGIIAPFGSQKDDIFQTATWVSDLHQNINRLERYKVHIQAFRGILSQLPLKGDPRHIITIYHQLEQFGHELDDADLASLDAGTREAMQAVIHVHDNLRNRVAELKQQYGL